MTLGEAQVGSTVVVTKIEGDGAYKRRIMDMGITKGTELYIRKVAPLGDPVEITRTTRSAFRSGNHGIIFRHRNFSRRQQQ